MSTTELAKVITSQAYGVRVDIKTLMTTDHADILLEFIDTTKKKTESVLRIKTTKAILLVLNDATNKYMENENG